MKKISPANFGGDDGTIKLRRQGRKPLVNFYRKPEDAPTFDLTDLDWDKLKRAYGAELTELSDGMRDKIKEGMEDYFWFCRCAGGLSR
jgi:hypothetical protein